MAQSLGDQAIEPLSSGKADCPGCRATGAGCFLGIDPDIYGMPLVGQYIQSGDRVICATQNWSRFPPEAFSIDFLRQFWFLMTPQDHATTEPPLSSLSRPTEALPTLRRRTSAPSRRPRTSRTRSFASSKGARSGSSSSCQKRISEAGLAAGIAAGCHSPDYAPTAPHKLRGFSYGSSQLQKAMAMNYSSLPVEYRFKRDGLGNVVVDDADTARKSRV